MHLIEPQKLSMTVPLMYLFNMKLLKLFARTLFHFSLFFRFQYFAKQEAAMQNKTTEIEV